MPWRQRRATELAYWIDGTGPTRRWRYAGDELKMNRCTRKHSFIWMRALIGGYLRRSVRTLLMSRWCLGWRLMRRAEYKKRFSFLRLLLRKLINKNMSPGSKYMFRTSDSKSDNKFCFLMVKNVLYRPKIGVIFLWAIWCFD